MIMENMLAYFARRDDLGSQRGQALVIFALAAAFLVGIAGLAIEGGQAQSDRRFLQEISDGGALAGARWLTGSPTNARAHAVEYVFSGLSQGDPTVTNPVGCDGMADITPATAACQPGSAYQLTVTTPYNGNSDQILVQIHHVTQTALSRAVGITSLSTAGRAVARHVIGGAPFPYALYARSRLTNEGYNGGNVAGDVYVHGCIDGGNRNKDTITTTASGGAAGNVLVYSAPATVGGPDQYQAFNPLGGAAPAVTQSTATCGIVVNSPAGVSGYGAAGHDAGSFFCGTVGPFGASCPAGMTSVPDVGVPTFENTDISNNNKACDKPTALVNGGIQTAGGPGGAFAPGCYDACAINNLSSAYLRPGIYAFYDTGAAQSCTLTTTGAVVCDSPAIPTPVSCPGGPTTDSKGTDGQTMAGVTIYLYNGTQVFTDGGDQLAAPQNPTTPGKNAGMLLNSCLGPGCSSGTGQIYIRQPFTTTNWAGTVYAPGSQCIVHDNATWAVHGQIICDSFDDQSGNQGTGLQVTYGGGYAPPQIQQTSLLE
ncbi:MAG: TadE/TadG family type IV pilus assembly protein [Candidatus Dormibacteria bacterium]